MRKPICGLKSAGRPYSVLLPVGFTLPPPLPGARCALTAPFHPYPTRRAGGLLSVALSLGSPPPAVSRHRVSVEPGLSSIPERTATIRPSGPGFISWEQLKRQAGWRPLSLLDEASRFSEPQLLPWGIQLNAFPTGAPGKAAGLRLILHTFAKDATIPAVSSSSLPSILRGRKCR